MKVRENPPTGCHVDGWRLVRQTGSHRQFQHARKQATVTVAGKPGETSTPRPRLDPEAGPARLNRR